VLSRVQKRGASGAPFLISAKAAISSQRSANNDKENAAISDQPSAIGHQPTTREHHCGAFTRDKGW
jgi:hypothetical protein